MRSNELQLGNGAIAQALLESGAEVVTGYPGTPSTEIIEEVLRQSALHGREIAARWCVNEKVAFDVALAATWCGKRAATTLKQVGLNVASDSLLSAAYTGVEGGFVVVVCDDPGPHSSQTEQDSRLFALFAKVPVLDPVSPADAHEMTREAFELSERHGIPVLLRPTTRVCHARQAVRVPEFSDVERPVRFRKDPGRWAATPRFRFQLHGRLNEKLQAIREEFEVSALNGGDEGSEEGERGIIASGHAWATVRDLLDEENLAIPLLRIGTPFPLPLERVTRFVNRFERVLVLEEPDVAIETQIADRGRIEGRLSGHVPSSGELTQDVIAGLLGLDVAPPHETPGPPPQLCVGCGHRSAFLALRQALPRAIFSGDIGCYTLGINQRALDTCLDMGASITLAEGFALAHSLDRKDRPIVAIIGDSTFFHSGMTGLLNAVTTGARIVVLILDNGTVAMTGAQSTPADAGASIERIAEGLGVRYVRTIDPYDVEATSDLLRDAQAFTEVGGGGPAVVVARRPCALEQPGEENVPVVVDQELCVACDACIKLFGCAALVQSEADGKVSVDDERCIHCGMCIPACPHDAILPRPADVEVTS